MKIGFVSSYNEKCGISSYTKNLVEWLCSNKYNVKVAANIAKDQVEPDEQYISRFFHCPFMTNQTTCNIDGLINYLSDRDIIHVQFETSLYHPSWFQEFITKIKPNKKVIFTMHSSGIWSDFDLSLIDYFITHEQMWCSNAIIPMGVQFFNKIVSHDPNKIITFGLGRNMNDWVEYSIKDSNIQFETSFGYKKWIPLKELVKFIQSGQVVSLLYPPVGANVSSSAITLALGCDRPIIVTNTNWFAHVNDLPGVYFVDNKEECKEVVNYLFDPSNKNEIDEDITNRNKQIIYEKKTFKDFATKHVDTYKLVISH